MRIDNLIHVDFDDDFDDSYYEQAAEQIYDNGGYNPEMLSTQKGSALINETFRVFNTAIDKGLGEEPDPKVSAALRENAFIFSGFKTHAELEQVSQMLTDEKGNIKLFNEFLNDIQSINQDYNHNYLRTEYNQALQAAQMAGKWADFEKNKNFINLQYRTANDERVRASHRILHGTTLPVDDPFWKQYTPPNGWGCRCTVVAVLKDDYPVQDSHGSIAKAESCFKTPKEKMFKENLAEKKRLFPSKHPYLPKGCGECKKTLLAYNPNSIWCKACGVIRKCRKGMDDNIEIVDTNGNKATPKDLRKSLAKDFDFSQLGKTINDKIKDLKCGSEVSQKVVIRKNSVRLFVKNEILTFATHFEKDKDGNFVILLHHIWIDERWQKKGIASKIIINMYAQAQKIGANKVKFVAKKDGSFTWAKKKYTARNRKSIFGLKDERAISIVNEFYKKHDENTPFPMYSIAKEELGEQVLKEMSWIHETIL
ncbi:MAG: phage head morphogenesis protein [Bacteroidales bacterium]|nr:phage head morphogenesis protein [Bacteroidales bacterium]